MATTARRLWNGFGIQAVLLVVSVGIITALLFGIDRQSRVLATSRMRAAEAREIEINVLGFAVGVHRYLQVGDPEVRRVARAEAEDVERAFANYETVATTPEREELAARLGSLWGGLRVAGEVLLGRAPGQATLEEVSRFTELLAAVETTLDEALQPEAVAAFDAAMARSSALIRDAIVVAALLAILGVGMSLGTARVVARGVAGTEAALTRRSGQLQSTFDAMQDGVAVFDREANLVEANHAFAVMHGYDGADDMKQHLSQFEKTFELFDASGQKLTVAEWPASRVLGGETYANLELRVRRRDTGSERLMSYSAQPVSQNGGYSHAILVARDITESVRAQRQFDEQSHLLQAVFDAAPTLIWVKDREGRFRVANRATADLHGTTPRALEGHTEADFGRVTAREGVEESVTSHETRETRWFQTVEVPLERPGASEPLVLGISTDITERKRLEVARATSEKRLRLLIESMPDAVLAVDESGSVIFASARAEQLFRYSADELVGQPIDLLVPEAKRARHAEQRREYMVAPEPRGVGAVRRELEARRKDGGTMPVEVSLSPISTPDGTIVMAIVRDLTATKALEDQLRQAQKMEAVGQLTGGIAHDLNNVLTVIMSNAEMLAEAEFADADSREDLAELVGAAQRGSAMIQRLLHFSRRATLTKHTIRPGDVVGGLAPMLRRLLPESIHIQMRDGSGPSDVVLGDTVAIEQMIVNLCTNARDAMANGGTLRIETDRTRLDDSYLDTHPWVAPGSYVCVAVSDDGVGMDEATLQRLFEPFFTTKPVSEGTGLGMAMVYGTMKQHGGMVHAYSELGHGTTIKLYFPLASSTTGAAPVANDPVPQASRGGTETILLAEDEPGIRRTTKRALEARGYEVMVAEDGAVALELFRRHRSEIDLVISDLVMPNLGGRQLVEALRAEGSGVRVLFTSGYSSDTVSGDSEFPPGVAFLQKPWTLDDLFARVRELLDAD